MVKLTGEERVLRFRARELKRSLKLLDSLPTKDESKWEAEKRFQASLYFKVQLAETEAQLRDLKLRPLIERERKVTRG